MKEEIIGFIQTVDDGYEEFENEDHFNNYLKPILGEKIDGIDFDEKGNIIIKLGVKELTVDLVIHDGIPRLDINIV